MAAAVGGVGIAFLSLGVCPRHGVRSRAGQWPRAALHACVLRVQKKIRFRDFWWACLGEKCVAATKQDPSADPVVKFWTEVVDLHDKAD